MTYTINARVVNERRTTTAETPEEALAAGKVYEEAGASAVSITMPSGGSISVKEFSRALRAGRPV